jgi:peptide/nickel transport system ATP-binding protein
MEDKLLEIKDLKIGFNTKKGFLTAVDGVNLSIKQGEILGIVGESGSGKSLTALAVMRLKGKISSGQVIFKGQDLTQKKEKEMRAIRGKQISMIFQDPMAALDPVYTCGRQIVETLKIHNKSMTSKDALNRSIELLKDVGIPSPETCVKKFPYELSGGMCQRVMIAMALACDPELLIADEPTTALDVTVQAQILDLLKKLRKEKQMSIIIITHDLGVIAEVTDRAVVMYAGKVMEEINTKLLFSGSCHPYTKGLIKSIPKLTQSDERLYSISGTVPSLSEIPSGCKFSTRCSEVCDKCRAKEPGLLPVGENHKACCWNIGCYQEDL